MSNTIKAVFASALFAASVFGGSQAFAASDGEYYPGASRHSVMDDGVNAISPGQGEGLDLFSTQSIDRPVEGVDPSSEIGPAEGDYYQGTVER